MLSFVAGLAGQDTVVTLPGAPGETRVIRGLMWSYNGPGTGRLTIRDGSASGPILLDVDTDSTTASLPFPLWGVEGNDLVVVLGAIALMVGKLNVYWW